MDYIIRFHAPNDVFVDHMNEAIEALKEPKQGEWIDDDINSNEKYHFFKCSVCGGDGVPRCNFCPNCGASMVKEGDEK